MLINFGKHSGKSVERLVLKHPKYALWLINQCPQTDGFARLVQEVERLVTRFDDLPIVVCCSEKACGASATSGTLHHGCTTPVWWCEACDPLAVPRPPTKLVRAGSYLGTCSFAAEYCNGREADLARLIKELAQAKGLPKRALETDLLAFFT